MCCGHACATAYLHLPPILSDGGNQERAPPQPPSSSGGVFLDHAIFLIVVGNCETIAAGVAAKEAAPGTAGAESSIDGLQCSEWEPDESQTVILGVRYHRLSNNPRRPDTFPEERCSQQRTRHQADKTARPYLSGGTSAFAIEGYQAPAVEFTLQRSWSSFSAPAYRNRGNRPSIRLAMRLAYMSSFCWTAFLPVPREPYGCDTRLAYRRGLSFRHETSGRYSETFPRGTA